MSTVLWWFDWLWVGVSFVVVAWICGNFIGWWFWGKNPVTGERPPLASSLIFGPERDI